MDSNENQNYYYIARVKKSSEELWAEERSWWHNEITGKNIFVKYPPNGDHWKPGFSIDYGNVMFATK